MTATDALHGVPVKIVYGAGLTEYINVEAPGSYRSERTRPSRVQPGWSCATAGQTPNIHHFGDHVLTERVIRLRRSIEDAARLGHDATVDELDLRVTTALQYVRRRLRLRYGARDVYGPAGDQGTDVREHWEKFDERPSYALAFAIDREQFERGRPAIVAWQGRPERGRAGGS